MEPLKETPDVKTKLMGLLCALKRPASKGMIKEFLREFPDTDVAETEADSLLEEVLKEPAVQCMVVDNESRYWIPPENKAVVIAQIGDAVRIAAMKAIVAPTLRKYGK